MAKISTLRKYSNNGMGDVLYPRTVTSAIVDWDPSDIQVNIDNVVQYTQQTKTAAEKQMARNNIGAISNSDVQSTINTTVNTAVNNSLGDIRDRLDALENSSGSGSGEDYSGEIGSIKADVSNLKTRTTAAEGNISQVQTNVTNVSRTVSSNSSAISNLQSQVESLLNSQVEPGVISSDVARLQSQITANLNADIKHRTIRFDGYSISSLNSEYIDRQDKVLVKAIQSSIDMTAIQYYNVGDHIIIGTNSSTYVNTWDVYRRDTNNGDANDFVLAFHYSDYNNGYLRQYPAIITAPQNYYNDARISISSDIPYDYIIGTANGHFYAAVGGNVDENGMFNANSGTLLYTQWTGCEDYIDSEKAPYKEKVYVNSDNALYVYDGESLQRTTDWVLSYVNDHFNESDGRIETLEDTVASISSSTEGLDTLRNTVSQHSSAISSANDRLTAVENVASEASNTAVTANNSANTLRQEMDSLNKNFTTVTIKYAVNSRANLPSDIMLGSYVAINSSSSTTIYRQTENGLEEVCVTYGSNAAKTAGSTVIVPKSEVVMRKLYSDTYFYYELNGYKFLVTKDGRLFYRGQGLYCIVEDPDTPVLKNVLGPDASPWRVDALSYNYDDTTNIVTSLNGFDLTGFYQSIKNINGDNAIETLTEAHFAALQPNGHNVGKMYFVVSDNPEAGINTTNPGRLVVFNGTTFITLN